MLLQILGTRGSEVAMMVPRRRRICMGLRRAVRREWTMLGLAAPKMSRVWREPEETRKQKGTAFNCLVRRLNIHDAIPSLPSSAAHGRPSPSQLSLRPAVSDRSCCVSGTTSGADGDASLRSRRRITMWTRRVLRTREDMISLSAGAHDDDPFGSQEWTF